MRVVSVSPARTGRGARAGAARAPGGRWVVLVGGRGSVLCQVSISVPISQLEVDDAESHVSSHSGGGW